jgi:hypothetical protein
MRARQPLVDFIGHCRGQHLLLRADTALDFAFCQAQQHGGYEEQQRDE